MTRAIAIPKGAILAPNGEIAQELALRNNWYEGSRWSPDRSWIWYPPQQAKKDLDRFTRYELIKHARYLYKNSPFVRGLIERLVVLTVGTGIYPVFKSDNEDFVKKATKIWMKRVKNVHLGPKCSFSLYVRALARARFLDGECCSIKTYDQRTYEARVQGVEAERLTGGQAGDNGTNETKNWLDGQKLDAQGNVVGYMFRGSDTIYEPEQVVHHYSPSRLGQYRGETILAASINTARDVDDILALEKQAVKQASATKDIIKTASGELDPETFRNLRYGNQFPTLFNLPQDDRTKDDYYKIQLGSQAVVLRRGDEYQPYKVDRTSPSWIGFMDFLSNTMCISTLIPPSVLLWIDTGGTDIRRDLDIAQRVVGAWQNDLIDELEELRQYLMADDFTDGELRNAPDDLEVVWHCPPKLTVDRAQAKEDRADVQAGLMSIEEFHARQGDDPAAYELAMVTGAKRRLALIKKAGFENVRQFVEVISLNAQLFQPDSEGEPEPEPSPGPEPKPKPKKK